MRNIWIYFKKKTILLILKIMLLILNKLQLAASLFRTNLITKVRIRNNHEFLKVI